MAVQLDEAAEAAEFAALVAELQAPEAGDDEDDTSDEAAPEAETSGDLEEDEDEDTESEDLEEKEETDEEDEDEEDLEDDEAEGLTAEELAAKKLFEAGDIKAACKRLGIDPKIFKINARQFTAMRKGLADATKLASEGRTKEARGVQLQAKAEEVYGPIVAGFQAYKGGDPMKLRGAIELMCEDSFENIVATVARAAKGLDPAQVEIIKLRKEMADRDAKEKETQAQVQIEAQSKAEVAKLSKALAKTPLAKIEGSAEEIYQLVLKSFDGTGYGLTVKQAYAQVKARHEKVAKAFGGKLQAPKAKAGKRREELAPVRKAPAKPLTREEKEAAERAEFAAVLKEAKEATRASERRSRRAK